MSYELIRVNEVALALNEFYHLCAREVAHEWYVIVHIGDALCVHFAGQVDRYILPGVFSAFSDV
jgi:hypothetical protein